MRVRLEYGRTGLEVDLPAERVVRTLAYKNAHAAGRSRGRGPRGARAARSARRRWPSWPAAGKDACIVICDITRPVPNKLILPPMLRTLEAAGIPRDEDH